MRISLHEPVGALGILLVFGVTASVLSSAATGRLLARVDMGALVVAGTALSALALATEALSPSLWVVASGFLVFGLGFGATDSALNVHAAAHFGARQINWMHASFGLGATAGPLLVTAMLSNGLTWRAAYGCMAAVLAALAAVFCLTRRSWGPPPPRAPQLCPDQAVPEPSERTRHRNPLAVVVLGSLTFTAVETGVESGAGVWGYIFLTAGRGLSHELAGVAVALYWAMMFLGRTVLGPVAERVGPARVLACAVGGVSLGAALMAVPGPALVAVIGMMALGLAAAPVFPLFTLTTGQRLGTERTSTTQTVSLQVAASAIGGAALPAGIGLPGNVRRLCAPGACGTADLAELFVKNS
jgi:fucose permease